MFPTGAFDHLGFSHGELDVLLSATLTSVGVDH